MPRPCKRRRICTEPLCTRFAPCEKDMNGGGIVTMALDEFECIRLMDLEGLTQEQCAMQMDVARTTVQAIYSSARKKACRMSGKWQRATYWRRQLYPVWTAKKLLSKTLHGNF